MDDWFGLGLHLKRKADRGNQNDTGQKKKPYIYIYGPSMAKTVDATTSVCILYP